MMNALTRTAFAAAVALAGAFGVATLTSGSAAASEMHSGIFFAGHHHDGGRRDFDRRGPSMHRGACSPQLALGKAHRIGIRHGRITRIDRHRVVVHGRSRHAGRSSIVFANRHSCPVIAYRR